MSDSDFADFRKQVLTTRPRITEAWVNIDGVPVQEGESRNSRAWGDILTSEVVPPIELLKLRDPEKFIAGGIHKHPEAWGAILEGHPSEKHFSIGFAIKWTFSNSASRSLASTKGPSTVLIYHLQKVSIIMHHVMGFSSSYLKKL